MRSVVGPGIGSARSKRSHCCDLQKYGRVEQLLQADDLRAAAGGLADERFGARQVGAGSASAWSWMMPMVNGGVVAARSMVTPPLSA